MFNAVLSILTRLIAGTPADSLESTKSVENCYLSPAPMHASVRHIEGKGIGYPDGYTSLDLFFSTSNLQMTTQPFLDLRGHVFDDGKLAFNAGLGVRHQGYSRIWGINAYYDNRFTKHRFYNQAGVGFESLGRRWDFRVNGYLPFGHRQSRWYGATFGEFEGNRLLVRRKQQLAMEGVDAEAAVHLNLGRAVGFNLGAGPYFFQAKDTQAYGGKLRFAAQYKDYVWIEVSGSYDTVFHDIVQGQVGLSLPFGPKTKIQPKPKRSLSCADLSVLKSRMLQPVNRQEIIVIDKRHRMDVAIAPSTGLPLNFLFVDNESPSGGTFESPYPTFTQALAASEPGDILYIFPGDGSSTGLTTPTSTPFRLLDNQQVLGASTVHKVHTTLGTISIPPLAKQMPHFAADTSGSPTSIMFVANNNTISGLHMTASGFIALAPAQQVYCIGSDGAQPNLTLTNFTVRNNLFEAQNGANGISFTYDSTNILPGTIVNGFVRISNNTLNVDPYFDIPDGTPAGMGIMIAYGNSRSVVKNNLFTSTIPGDAFPIAALVIGNAPASVLEMDIHHNTFDSFQVGIECTSQNSSFPAFQDLNTTVRIAGNTFTNISSNSAIDFEPNGTGPNSCTVTAVFENNQFLNFADDAAGIFVYAYGTTSGTYNLITNSFSNTGTPIDAGTNGTENVLFLIQNNLIQNNLNSDGAVAGIVIHANGTLSKFHVIANQITNISGDAMDISNDGTGILCLRFTDNYSPTNFFNLNNSGGGIFQVEPLLRNIPQPNTSATLTAVPENNCN